MPDNTHPPPPFLGSHQPKRAWVRHPDARDNPDTGRREYPHPTEPGRFVSRQYLFMLKSKKAGRCTLCGRPASTANYCLRHAIQQREYKRARLAKLGKASSRQNASLTRRLEAAATGQPPPQKKNINHEARRAAGLCTYCGFNPLATKNFCRPCANANNARIRRYAQNRRRKRKALIRSRFDPKSALAAARAKLLQQTVMIAISSLRPFTDCQSYAQLQIQAHQSWLSVFDEIIYVCKTGEDALRDPKTTFIIDDRPFIPIRFLADLASAASALAPLSVAAIINSDIVVTPRLKEVGAKLLAQIGLHSATSRRWTFYGDRRDELKLLPNDHGLDIFLTNNLFWKAIASIIPVQYCLGLPGWDEWVLRFLAASHTIRDFTSYRCILHPFHTERAIKPAIAVEQFSGPPPIVRAL